jgi:hypothetical protein
LAVATKPTLMTANEAASVTGVPLRQVNRIIDAGQAVHTTRHKRTVARIICEGHSMRTRRKELGCDRRSETTTWG